MDTKNTKDAKKQRPHLVINQDTKDEIDKLVSNKTETYNDIIRRLLENRIDIKKEMKE